MSLIEIVLIIFIVGFLVLLLGSIPNSMSLVSKAGHIGIAKEIAGGQLEKIRHESFANLTNGETEITDLRLSELVDGSGVVAIEDCDPSICTNGEDIKKVKVEVLWKEGGKSQNIILETLITEGGINN